MRSGKNKRAFRKDVWLVLEGPWIFLRNRRESLNSCFSEIARKRPVYLDGSGRDLAIVYKLFN